MTGNAKAAEDLVPLLMVLVYCVQVDSLSVYVGGGHVGNSNVVARLIAAFDSIISRYLLWDFKTGYAKFLAISKPRNFRNSQCT